MANELKWMWPGCLEGRLVNGSGCGREVCVRWPVSGSGCVKEVCEVAGKWKWIWWGGL